MGVVYRARDARLDRDVAVKILGDRFAAAGSAAQRFVGEAQITARLQHPGVPPVHQVGELADGRPYLAMKLIRGQTLDALLKGRADPSADRGRFVAVFEQICQAVAFAHASGIIHRDLKPGNVMVGPFGEVQVMDWGLAKVVDRGDGSEASRAATESVYVEESTDTARTTDWSGAPREPGTRAGSVLGTPAYMAPEQARGEGDLVDARADVFGLGGILCAILTGRPPFAAADGRPARELAAAGDLGGALGRLARCGAGPDWVALCTRCLSPAAGDRPADAGTVARAVAGLRAEADERARRAEVERAAAAAEAREQRKRRKVQLALAGLTLVVLAGAGTAGWWRDRQAREERGRLARNGDAVATALGQCETALRGDDASEAGRALDRASRQSEEGGAGHLADRVDRCRADLSLLRDLDAVDAYRWSAIGGTLPQPKEVANRWRAVFSRHGLGPGEVPTVDVAGRIAESLIGERLIATLDLWLAFERLRSVRDVLGAVDPDESRGATRHAILAGHADRAAVHGDAPGVLTGRPGLAVALGQLSPLPPGRRREFLLQALDLMPDRFTVLMELGASYPRRQKEGAAERVGWYQSAIAARPDSSIAWYNLGIARYDLGDLRGARAAYHRSIELDPERAVGSFNNLALLLADAGDPGGAIALLREAIRLLPSNSQLHNNLGHVLRRAKDPDGAIAAFREATRLGPEDPLPWGNLGSVLAAKKDFAGAAAAYREAIRLNSADADSRIGLGSVLFDLGKADEAADYFREAVCLDPNSALAHADLGNALSTLGDLDTATKEYHEAIRLDPKWAPAHSGLAGVLILQKKYAAAAASAREAVRIDPNLAHAHNNLGFALFKLQKLDESLNALRKAVELDPGCVAAHNNLGNTLNARNDLDGATSAYREAIRLDPKYARAYNGLGITRSEATDPPGAVSAFREFARLEPADPWAHVNLGIALHLSGAAVEAVAEFREGVRLDPKNPTAFARLGMVLLDLGRHLEAVDALRTATRLVPGNPVLVRELARAARLLALAERLPAIRARTAHPASPTEAVELAQFAARPPSTEFGLSLRLFSEAFAGDNALVTGNRFAAAAVAIQLAAGNDPSAPVGVDEWYFLQSRARRWLVPELAAVRPLAASPDPATRKRAADTLRVWQTDRALASVRNTAGLDGMPADERTNWAAFWVEVDAVRAEARRAPEFGPPPRAVE
jgi:tetratricopeptide (TPR) repeat protein